MMSNETSKDDSSPVAKLLAPLIPLLNNPEITEFMIPVESDPFPQAFWNETRQRC